MPSATLTEAREICREPADPQFRGFVVNCYWDTSQPGPDLFVVLETGHILPMLDGYAIIPKAEYERLTARPPKTNPES